MQGQFKGLCFKIDQNFSGNWRIWTHPVYIVCIIFSSDTTDQQAYPGLGLRQNYEKVAKFEFKGKTSQNSEVKAANNPWDTLSWWCIERKVAPGFT